MYNPLLCFRNLVYVPFIYQYHREHMINNLHSTGLCSISLHLIPLLPFLYSFRYDLLCLSLPSFVPSFVSLFPLAPAPLYFFLFKPPL
ncbi:hypothetical protein J3F84DRAFT_71743 [Trichoderma pleuroticola]